jgi:hypothetical protein
LLWFAEMMCSGGRKIGEIGRSVALHLPMMAGDCTSSADGVHDTMVMRQAMVYRLPFMPKNRFGSAVLHHGVGGRGFRSAPGARLYTFFAKLTSFLPVHKEEFGLTERHAFANLPSFFANETSPTKSPARRNLCYSAKLQSIRIVFVDDSLR